MPVDLRVSDLIFVFFASCKPISRLMIMIIKPNSSKCSTTTTNVQRHNIHTNNNTTFTSTNNSTFTPTTTQHSHQQTTQHCLNLQCLKDFFIALWSSAFCHLVIIIMTLSQKFQNIESCTVILIIITTIIINIIKYIIIIIILLL